MFFCLILLCLPSMLHPCCVDSSVLFTWIIWSENDGWSDRFEGRMFLNTIDIRRLARIGNGGLRVYQAATKISIGEALVLILVAANACRNTSLEGLNPLLWGFWFTWWFTPLMMGSLDLFEGLVRLLALQGIGPLPQDIFCNFCQLV